MNDQPKNPFADLDRACERNGPDIRLRESPIRNLGLAEVAFSAGSQGQVMNEFAVSRLNRIQLPGSTRTRVESGPDSTLGSLNRPVPAKLAVRSALSSVPPIAWCA